MATLDLATIPEEITTYEALAVWALEELASLVRRKEVRVPGGWVPAVTVDVRDAPNGEARAYMQAFIPVDWGELNSGESKTWMAAGELVMTGLRPAPAPDPDPDPDPEPEVPTDPSFSSVLLLLHMDGSNGSTTFADSSSNAHTVSVFGNAQITASNFKFGTGALALDGSGDYLVLPSSSAFALGTDDFTIEFWVYFTSTSGNQFVFDARDNSLQNSWGFYLTSGALNFAINLNSGVGFLGTGSLSAGAWHNIAATRSGTTFRMYLNGTQTATNTSSITYGSPGSGITMGGRHSRDSGWLNGYIDELRITKGVARYVSDFTPPAAPFPDS